MNQKKSKPWIISCSILIISITINCGCMSAGTLGATANKELDCPESTLEYELDQLKAGKFKIPEKDTSAVNWWKTAKYDFLNYNCLYINKTLYMVTIDSENSVTSEISIRSFYSRKRKEWIFSTEFSTSQNSAAENAMSYLLKHLSNCNV